MKNVSASARPTPTDRRSVLLVELSVLLPLLAILESGPVVRAAAAATVMLVLPGLALARLLRLDDRVLFVLVTVTGSLATAVVVTTGLMYAGLWSWQLSLGLLGGGAAVAALLTGPGGDSR